MKRIILSVAIVFLLGIIFVRPFHNFVQDITQRNKAQKEERKIIGATSIYNPRIQEVQRNLKELGFETGPLDGIMGSKTRQAIAQFQRQNNLWPHGKIDLKTYQEINRQALELKKEKTSEISKLQLQPQGQSKDEKFLEEKKSSVPKDKKKQIQYALKRAGFYKGDIDGKIGPKTKQAIKEFQKANNLKPDGIVGKQTWKHLERYLE